jgi:hypothetical protein
VLGWIPTSDHRCSQSSIIVGLYSITLTLTSCINKEKVRIVFFVADVIVLFLMECYILNDGCGTSSVKALSSICYSVDVVPCAWLDSNV